MMDFLETTIKVIENRSVVRENLNSSELDLQQLEQHLDQLNDKFQETQAEHSRTLEILEINNLTKAAFNTNCKIVRNLLTKVYKNLQDLEGHLDTIFQRKNSVTESYSDNAERINKVKNRFTNDIKLFDIMEKDVRDESGRKASAIELEINKVKTEQENYEELWKNAVDEIEDKQRNKQTIQMEIEILQDKTDKENHNLEVLIKQKSERDVGLLEQYKSETEKTNKLQLGTKEIYLLSRKCMEVYKTKEELQQKKNELNKVSEQLKKNILVRETDLKQAEIDSEKHTEELDAEIHLKRKNIKKIETELLSCQANEKKLSDEIDNINSGITTVKDKLLTLSPIFESNEHEIAELNHNLASIELDDLVKQTADILESLSKCESEISVRQNERDTIKTVSRMELSEIKPKLQMLETESAKNLTIEKEIEDIELANTKMQQTVDQTQTRINELNGKSVALKVENEEIQQALKYLTFQCDNVQKEVQRLKASKEKKIKLTPIPTPKRTTQLKRRYPSSYDVESDSSVDGEKMSYQEFMAKKNRMKEKKLKNKNKNLLKFE